MLTAAALDLARAVAVIVFALAALVLSCAVLLLVWRKGLASIVVDIRQMRAEVRAINRAVNCVPAGTPPLVERVHQITDKVEAIASTVGAQPDERND